MLNIHFLRALLSTEQIFLALPLMPTSHFGMMGVGSVPVTFHIQLQLLCPGSGSLHLSLQNFICHFIV